MAQFDLKNATLFFKDGSNPRNMFRIKLGDGNFTATEKRNVEYTNDGGRLDEVRSGDEEPMELSIDGTWLETAGRTTSPDVTTSGAVASAGATSAALATPQLVATVSSIFKHAGVRYTVVSATDSLLTFTPALMADIPASTTLVFEAVELTLEDVLKQRKGARGWVSSDSDVCRPYALDVVLSYSSCGDAFKEVTYPDFRYEQLVWDASAATVSLSGKCNAVEPLAAL